MPGTQQARWTALALVAGLVGLDGGGFGPVLPAVRADLGLDDPRAAWLLSAYVVGTLLGNPANAVVATRWGARRALVLGLAVYAVGAGAMAGAPDGTVAYGARWLQGLGAGSLLAIATAAATEATEPGRRGRVTVLLALGYGVTFVFASGSGSFFAEAWRALYAGLGGLALLAAAAIARALPAGGGRAAPFDRVGAGLWALTTVAVGVLVPQLRGAGSGGLAWLAAGVATAGGVAVVVSARRSAHPFLPLDLLRRPSVLAACLLTAGAGAGQVVAVVLPSFAAVILGVEARAASLWTLPFVVAGLVGTALAAAWIDRVGARRLVSVAVALTLLGGAGLLAAPAEPLAFVGSTLLLGAGVCTLSGGPLRHLAAAETAHDGPRAQALLSLVTNVGLLVGSALHGALGSAQADVGARAGGMLAGVGAVGVVVSVCLLVGLRLAAAPAGRVVRGEG